MELNIHASPTIHSNLRHDTLSYCVRKDITSRCFLFISTLWYALPSGDNLSISSIIRSRFSSFVAGHTIVEIWSWTLSSFVGIDRVLWCGRHLRKCNNETNNPFSKDGICQKGWVVCKYKMTWGLDEVGSFHNFMIIERCHEKICKFLFFRFILWSCLL